MIRQTEITQFAGYVSFSISSPKFVSSHLTSKLRKLLLVQTWEKNSILQILETTSRVWEERDTS